jgi:hypothetical protein
MTINGERQTKDEKTLLVEMLESERERINTRIERMGAGQYKGEVTPMAFIDLQKRRCHVDALLSVITDPQYS